MTRVNRNRNTVSVATPKIKFTAPLPGLEDVQFANRNGKAAAEFGIVRSELARHIVSIDRGDMGS